MYRIRCCGVSKKFHLHSGRKLLRDHLFSLFRRMDETAGETFHALRDVSFEVQPGESLAVLGANGAGKSTLLSLIAGLSEPDAGTIEVNGRIAALLALGSGFHPDLTGRENVRLNAALLGYAEQQARDAFDSIVEFAGVEEFIDEPLRTYSSGMSVRLAFAIAVNLSPEILIIDEVLAVGDAAFQQKCLERISYLRASGRTLICVSHSPQMLYDLCDQAIWLDHGRLVMSGTVRQVVAAYSGTASVAIG